MDLGFIDRVAHRATIGVLALIGAALTSGCFGWDWAEGTDGADAGGMDAAAAPGQDGGAELDAGAGDGGAELDAGAGDDGGAELDAGAGDDGGAELDAGAGDGGARKDAGLVDQADAGPDAGGTWERCCVGGVVQTCFCRYGDICDPFGWVDCGDGTCRIESGPCPSES